MWRNVTVNLSDLLFSVSEVMDLSDATLVDHQIRSAFVCAEVARVANLDYAHAERLFVAALLHDIGALSPEEKVGAHIYEDVRPEPHCLRGGKLFREAFWLAPSAQIVEWHHATMTMHAQAGRFISDVDVFCAQIVYLADHLERFIQRDRFILHQAEKLRARIRALAGREIHAEVVEIFDQVSANDGFWLELVAKDLERQLRERDVLRSLFVNYETARSVAEVFKDMTDFRSRFTATHSSGVSACAVAIAEHLAFTGKDLQQIQLAGLLHDIGKLVVPNAILCKGGNLTDNERAVIRQHPFYTYRILSRVRGLEQIAEWAGFHHERLDGSGYFKKLDREDLDLGSKVIAVADVATAIAESRPYRASGDQNTVISQLREMAQKGQLETLIVEVLTDNYTSIMARARSAQAADEARFIERYAHIEQM